MPQRSAARILCVASVLFCVFTGSSRASEENVLALEFTVSNPAPESQEVDVNVDLPKGLRVEDFISTDGLDLAFQQDRQAYAVQGKVVLQAGETTLYRVKIKDIWMIGNSELDQYRAGASKLPDVSRERLLDLIVKIERNQAQTRSDIKARIAAYQENKAQLREFDLALIGGSGRGESAVAARRWLDAAAAAVVLAAIFFVMLLRKGARRPDPVPAASDGKVPERRKLDRIIEPPDVECRLLMSRQSMPLAEEVSVAPKDLSEGGICLDLPDPYRSQSVIEIKMKLPNSEHPLTFRGSVVWQKKVLGEDSKHSFMTGIHLGEATYEDYQKLKDYVGERLR
jgi:hypothetical protein